ncbi:MAG: autotransporter-associated beta strand repeat-containing protein [Akkermansia sp.]|nr:autotransporter-associated beta strand repeat-containing protein [Akkermansia sp.]
MKLHLPLSLLTTLLASTLLGAPAAQAVEIPSGYTVENLADPSELYDYRSSSYSQAFILDSSVSFSPSTATWWKNGDLKSNGEILFTIEEDGDPYSLSFKDASYQAFDVTNLRIEDIGKVSFTGINTTTGSSSYGAIEAFSISLLRNREVNIISNRQSRSDNSYNPMGGAIYTTGSLKINENTRGVTISVNRATQSISSSTSSYSYGGAIYGGLYASISLDGNSGGVTITGNYASSTSSYSSYSYSYSYGGAIFGDSYTSISLDGNSGGVVISGNYASSSSFSSSSTYYAMSYSYGGAIYGGSGSTLSISGNTGTVTINDNAAIATASAKSAGYTTATALGGAIYSEGSIAILNNGDVLFTGNYEKAQDTYRLRSIYMDNTNRDGGRFHLSAAAGKNITFEDSVYVATRTSGQTVDVVFNGSYTDAGGNAIAQGGDIIFDGGKAASVLQGLKADASDEEILNSQTSYIGGLINLQAGRLVVRDGAHLDGLGLSTKKDSGAVLVLQDGHMNHGSGSINLRRGTSLELSGQNSITADAVTFSTGSTLQFSVGEAQRQDAVLNLDATLEYFSINLALEGDGMLASGRYKLLELADAAQYSDADGYWNADDITVSATGDAAGLGFNDLVWENGTLYVQQVKSEWSNASGDARWNASSANWQRHEHVMAYQDGMDVLFAGAGAGEVQLEGEIAPLSVTVDNAAGQDYTFTGSGRLTGETSVTKTGAGELSIANANDYTGGTQLLEGTLRVQHAGALGGAEARVSTAAGSTLSVENGTAMVLAAATGNDLNGQVEVQAGASLEMRGTGYHAESTRVEGELVFSGSGVNHTGNGAGSLSGSGKLTVQGAGASAQFSSAADFTGSIALAEGAALSADEMTVSAVATLTAVAAGTELSLSDALLTGTSTAQVEMHTSELVYTGTLNVNVAANSYSAGTLELQNGLTLEGGATYQASGSSIDLGGSSLTFATGGSAGGDSFVKLMLALDCSYNKGTTQIVLFSGVSELNIGSQVFTTGNKAHTFAAADYVEGSYVTSTTALVYDSESGLVYIIDTVPEPATATLSLLALTGLAMRRRRK